jgi:TolB-like protein
LINHHCKNKKTISGLFFLFFLAFALTAGAEDENAQKAKKTNRIAVISFQALTPDAGNTVFCPLCGSGSSSGKVLEGAEKIVEQAFVDRLNKIKGVEIIPSEKAESVYKRIASENLKENFIETLKKVGSELGADFLAVGYVYRYTERVGYQYSSEHPASVIFEIHLVKAADGSIVWQGHFDKTQKSLMENILDISSFFKGGAKWVTARQLTGQGMDKIFKTFPDFQN